MTHRGVHSLLMIWVILMGLTACSTAPTQREFLKQTYDRSAQYHAPDRNPVIVIPGILGSRLVDEETGRTIWGAFRSKYADPNSAEDVGLIALPIDQDSGFSTGNYTRVRPDGVLESLELRLAGIPLEVQAYKGILTTLGAGGYRDESLGINSIDYGTDHYTCFQFDYDWRQDISSNAERLKQFIDERRRDVQVQYEKEYGLKNAPVKFDIVAHSMGALLTRYFLRYGGNELPSDGFVPPVNWSGTADVDRAILVAPPNAGSLDAVDQLVNGFNKGGPLIPAYAPVVLGTFPSIYQLLPRPRHGRIIKDGQTDDVIENIYDPKTWQELGWGLSGRDEKTQGILANLLPGVDSADDRLTLAQRYQATALARAEQFHKALDVPADPPKGLDLFLIAGDALPTPEYFSVDTQTGELDNIGEVAGDSVVARFSALLDERVGGTWQPTLKSPIKWDSVLFLPSSHRDITSHPTFEDNVLYWLLEDPR